MDRMCNIQLMDDYCPNWKSYNDNHWLQFSSFFESVSIRASFLYCEGCGREMYWPILDATVHDDIIKYKHHLDDRLRGMLPSLEGAYKRVHDRYEDHVEKIKIIEKCPFCGEEVNYGLGYVDGAIGGGKYPFLHSVFDLFDTWLGKREYKDFSEDAFEKEVERYFEKMRSERLKKIEKEETKEATDYSKMSIGSFVMDNKDESDDEVLINVKLNNIKSSPENLKQFVLDILKMETSIYGMKKRLEDLYFKRKKDELQYKHEIEENNRRKVILERRITEKEEEIERFAPTRESLGIFAPNEPQKVTEPVLSKPGLFNKKKVEAENKRLQDQYQEQMDKYKIQCQEYQATLLKNEELYTERVEAEKQKMGRAIQSIRREIEELSQGVTTSSLIEDIIDKEIEMAESALRNTYITRNSFYNTNIIYTKYRNPVALSSFYEYLISGRCTGLEGADGAYNIYENEIRLNLIIDQLDQVIDSLDQIKNNQFTIYNELKEVNSNLSSLNNSMNKAIESIQNIESNSVAANKKLDDISNNTAVTAYYSKINAYYAKKNAQLTKAVAWLVALK